MSVPLSKHIATVKTSTGIDNLETTDISIRIEETWSPYIQGTVTCPMSLEGWLDPRNGDRLSILLEQQFGAMLHPDDITRSFVQPALVSDYTAGFSPVKPRTVTNAYVVAWNSFGTLEAISYLTANVGGTVSDYTALFTYVSDVTRYLAQGTSLNPPPATVFLGDLAVRSIAYNQLENVSVITVSSDEALLQDYAWVSATPYTPATTDVATLVNYVLSKIGASLAAGNATGIFDNTDVKWLPGQSGWDFINPIVQKANLVLYCDEGRNWRLVDAVATAGTLTLDDTSNIIELTNSIDIARDYFDSCVVEYSWYNGTAQQVAYDIYAPVGSVKTRNVKISDTPFPGTGLAYALTQRALTRSQMFELSAVSNYDARPRQSLNLNITGQTTKTAVISSINWMLPADTMSISIRNLVEV